MVMRRKLWLIVGFYAPLGRAADIKHITMVPVHCPDCVYPILVWDINVNLSKTEGTNRGEDLVAIIEVRGLEDMVTHF